MIIRPADIEQIAMRHKIIIDTDAGIDDAMAISFAFAHPHIEVIGITSIFGNVPLKTATTNALRLCAFNGKKVPVCEGESDVVGKEMMPCPEWIHGANGFGDISVPESDLTLDQRSAVDFIAAQLSAMPGEISLVPIGPLTNIARLVERYPAAVEQAKQVVLMGGAAHVTGNVTPLAEFNIAGDPEAADTVCAAAWPVTMIGLDVTGNTVLTADIFTKISAANPKLEFLGDAAKQYIDFYTKQVGLAGCCMHDVCAVACVIEPDIFDLVEARIRVECEGFSRGYTAVMPDRMENSLRDWVTKPQWVKQHFPHELAIWLDRPRQRYAASLDKQRMTELFVETLCAAD